MTNHAGTRRLEIALRIAVVVFALLAGLVAVTGSGAAQEPGAIVGATDGPPLPLPGQKGFPPVKSGPATASREILPNLVAQSPAIPVSGGVGFPAVRTVLVGGATHYELGFNSAFSNTGPGPVIVYGHRKTRAATDMTADQYILLKGGKYALRPNVGALRFIKPVNSLSHNHWHYLGTEVYELYPAGHFSAARRYHKQGFCMAEPPSVFPTYCGYKDTTELHQVEGMLSGTTDYYNAGVEGQDIDITGLPAGQYVLINWVNSQCQLKETTYADNAAINVLTLTYPNGVGSAPAVAAGQESMSAPHLPCPAPRLTADQATRYVQNAIVRKTGKSASQLRLTCHRVSATEFGCTISWRARSASYSGRITVAHVASSKFARYVTALSGVSAHASFVGRAGPHSLRWTVVMHPLRDVQPAHP